MNIEARLASLEKSNRRLRAGLVFLVLVSVAAFHFGGAPDVQDVVRVHRLEVVNDQGRCVISLENGKLGGTAEFNNNAGKKSVTIDSLPLGGMVAAGGEDFNGAQATLLCESPLGGSVAAVRIGPDGPHSIGLSAGPNAPAIEVTRGEKTVWKAP